MFIILVDESLAHLIALGLYSYLEWLRVQISLRFHFEHLFDNV